MGCFERTIRLMAAIQNRGGKWQLRVVHKLLPKPYFSTFPTREEAQDSGRQLEALLDRGTVPAEMAETEKRGDNPLLSKLITDYLAQANVAPSDRPVLALVGATEGNIRLQTVSAAWADLWVYRLKVEQNLAPSSIRKRVESLARVIDAYWRSKNKVSANPLRMMPRGYAAANERDAALIKAAGAQVKRDVSRDRRLSPSEYAACRAALAGQHRADRERPLPHDPAFALLFDLITHTGLRLSEAYRLRVDQVDVHRWVIHVEGSKGHRGLIKPRIVPLVPVLRPQLAAWCTDRVGLMFNFWNGSDEDKVRASSRLSGRFRTLFDYAGVAGCTEHDLRHHATCLWFEMRHLDGRWIFSEIEICKIMGWSDTRMALRYASMRAEDLASRFN